MVRLAVATWTLSLLPTMICSGFVASSLHHRQTSFYRVNHLFVIQTTTTTTRNTDSLLVSTRTTALHAAAKKKRSSSGKGFRRASIVAPKVPSEEKEVTTNTDDAKSAQPRTGLTSIDTTDTTSSSVEVDSNKNTPVVVPKMDSNLPAEERTKQILKERYGLKSFQEQRRDIEMARADEAEKNKKIVTRPTKEEEFDIFRVLPAPVIRALDLFLKTGLTISVISFVVAGLLVTVEAWSVATHSPIPPELDTFIVHVVEPNFTPGLLVLLGFSVTLGLFAAAQLGSASGQYKE